MNKFVDIDADPDALDRSATWQLLQESLWDFKTSRHARLLESWLTNQSFDQDLVEALLRSNRLNGVAANFYGPETLHELYCKWTQMREFMPEGGGLYIFSRLAWKDFLKVGQTGDFRDRLKYHMVPSKSRMNGTEIPAYYLGDWDYAIKLDRISLLLLPLPCKNEFLRKAMEHVLIEWLNPIIEPSLDKDCVAHRKRRHSRQPPPK